MTESPMESESIVSDEDYQASSESENNNSDNCDEAGGRGQSGLANVFTLILNKSVKQNHSAILAKGTSDRVIHKRKLLREAKEKGEDENEESKKKKVSNSSAVEQIQKRKRWEEIGHCKPNPLEKETERNLQKIATRGVVQLFNAVLKQQKTIDEELDKTKMTERKKDKVIGSMTKGKFLDMLKGTPVTEIKGRQSLKEKGQSDKIKKENNWSVLRDDFMMGAKMKDWDKESSDDGGQNESNGSDLDLSDD